jgi:hypothetical protein
VGIDVLRNLPSPSFTLLHVPPKWWYPFTNPQILKTVTDITMKTLVSLLLLSVIQYFTFIKIRKKCMIFACLNNNTKKLP